VHLQGRARVASRLHVACETPALQRRRPSQRALAPDEGGLGPPQSGSQFDPIT
jgi:hypothetical protein